VIIETKDKELTDTRSKIVALESENLTLKADLDKFEQDSKENKL